MRCECGRRKEPLAINATFARTGSNWAPGTKPCTCENEAKQKQVESSADRPPALELPDGEEWRKIIEAHLDAVDARLGRPGPKAGMI